MGRGNDAKTALRVIKETKLKMIENHGQGQYNGKFEGYGQGQCRDKVVGHGQYAVADTPKITKVNIAVYQNVSL